MAGIPSDLGSKLQAPQFGDVRDQLMQQFGPQGAPDPNDQDEAVLAQLVADAHKLAAELTHYAVMERQEDQTEGAPPVGGPPMPPGVGGGPQGM